MENEQMEFEAMKEEVLKNINDPDLAETLDYITRAKIQEATLESTINEFYNYVSRKKHTIELCKKIAWSAYERFCAKNKLS